MRREIKRLNPNLQVLECHAHQVRDRLVKPSHRRCLRIDLGSPANPAWHIAKLPLQSRFDPRIVLGHKLKRRQDPLVPEFKRQLLPGVDRNQHLLGSMEKLMQLASAPGPKRLLDRQIQMTSHGSNHR